MSTASKCALEVEHTYLVPMLHPHLLGSVPSILRCRSLVGADPRTECAFESHPGPDHAGLNESRLLRLPEQ